MASDRHRPPYVLVSWNGRCTRVLLVQADRSIVLITEGADPALVEDLKAQYPALPFDVRPGAYGIGTAPEEEKERWGRTS